MAVEVAIPQMGESVSQVILLEWVKADGEHVERDEPICVLETDKANVDLPAPAAGILRTVRQVDETLEVGEIVARIETTEEAQSRREEGLPVPRKAADPEVARVEVSAVPPEGAQAGPDQPLSPAVRRLVEEHRLDPAAIPGTGRDGRLTKEDVVAYLGQQEKAAGEKEQEKEREVAAAPPPAPVAAAAGEGSRRVPMSRLRQRLAERLVAAQHHAAILTTFNEVDMSAVMALRTRYKERFAEVHGVSLGLMSFFSRAVVVALKEFEVVNASIEGTDIVYHDYVNLGIAVSTDRGLLVPVLRGAEKRSMAQIETEIKRLAKAARDNRLSIDELSGGTFTITNGGIFGSLLSTPILNPPQSGILGMHAIKERPVAVEGRVEIRPVMYVALSYDHRLVDGQQSVSFLVRVKERLEDPARLMLEV